MLCWYALTFKFSRSGHRRDGRFCPQIGGKNRRQLIYLFHPEMRRWSLQGLPQQVNMFSRERPHSRFKVSWEDDLPVKICSFPGGYLLIKSRLFLFHIKMHLQLLYYCEGLPSVFLDIVRYSFGGQPSSFAALLDIEWLRSLATLTTGFWTFLNAPPPPKKKCYVFYFDSETHRSPNKEKRSGLSFKQEIDQQFDHFEILFPEATLQAPGKITGEGFSRRFLARFGAQKIVKPLTGSWSTLLLKSMASGYAGVTSDECPKGSSFWIKKWDKKR